ncbi:MAG: hypothetical protein P8R42_21110 [Candidatus Binatia bacterium]|nr:hypothetical protein [Candidatus Binatia bacterium]
MVLATAANVPAAAEPQVRSCADLYFGITAPPDFESAYACLDAARARPRGSEVAPDWLGQYAPLVLMRLNGDGVPVDLDAASALVAQWQAVDPANTKSQLFLRRILLERRAGLSAEPGKTLVFCELPGGTSLESRCEEVRRRREEARREEHVHAVRERVPEAARAELSGLLFHFGGYSDREGARIERARVLEDDAESAAQRQRVRVQADFDAVVRRALVEHVLEPVSALDASRRERALETTYAEDRRERAESFVVYERALPDSAETYERYRRRYDDAAEQSQAAWRRYRDAWVTVVRAASGSDPEAAAGEAAIRSLLAAQRTKALRPD